MKMQPLKKEDLILFFVILLLSLIPLTVMLVSCGGGGGGGSGGTSNGTVTTTITDPPTCLSPDGPFKNVWVTITRVQAHTSGSADQNASGWVELVDLRNQPIQIDLLSLTSTTCLLTQLGSTSGIPTGKYQQIRIYLLSNSPAASELSPSPNHCGGNGFNCVVLADNSIQTLLLSSESQTGIKIPPGQISGGGLTVAEGQTVDLNIEFDACSSIVQQGNGQFRLKPTLHAGEISINTSTISGRVIDENTTLPLPNAIVLLEIRDPIHSGIDRVLTQKLTGSDGRFIFCSLPQGTYDVVVDARTAGITYNTAVTLQVPLGRDMGDIPLVPEPGGALPATISGQVTTSTGTAATSADIQLSALQSVSVVGSSPLLVTIPLFANSTPNIATQSIITCPSNTDCANFTLNVPAGNPQAGVFRISPPTSYATQAGGNYSVEAQAFIPMSGGLQDCSPSDQTVQNIIVASGATTSINAPITFSGCQ